MDQPAQQPTFESITLSQRFSLLLSQAKRNGSLPQVALSDLEEHLRSLDSERHKHALALMHTIKSLYQHRLLSQPNANDSIVTIALNFTDIDLDRNLGVLSFFSNLTASLAQTDSVRLIYILGPSGAQHPFVHNLNSQGMKPWRNEIPDFELLAHHFQKPRTTAPYLVICHDLHIWDVPWKYTNPSSMRLKFLSNMNGAAAVVTHFPRTYTTLSIHFSRKVHLTISPPLLNLRAHTDTSSKTVADLLPRSQSRLLLYPAQFQEHKNHIRLLQALAIAIKRGADITLVCTGSHNDDAYFASFKEAILELSLVNKVVYLGHLTDSELASLYGLVDGVIHPSLAEGGAYVALEACLAGKPIALSNTAQVRAHLALFGGHWHLFDPLDIESIAIACQSVANTPLPSSQQQSAITALSWGFIAREYLQIIDHLSKKYTRS
jgi:glycosyltransferase involved in cell wall biosynthesis